MLTTLTSRYITSPETVMDQDIRRFSERGYLNFAAEVESAELSETFWNIGLVQNLETSAVNSPYFNVFLASQIFKGDSALFSNGTKISDLVTVIGDVHHIFPKKYLIKNGYTQKSKYNQIANFTYLDTQVNKAVGDDAPNVYFQNAFSKCGEGEIAFGNIADADMLMKNLKDNCIPEGVVNMDFNDYEEFLVERRKLMAEKIKDYYYSL